MCYVSNHQNFDPCHIPPPPLSLSFPNGLSPPSLFMGLKPSVAPLGNCGGKEGRVEANEGGRGTERRLLHLLQLLPSALFERFTRRRVVPPAEERARLFFPSFSRV